MFEFNNTNVKQKKTFMGNLMHAKMSNMTVFLHENNAACCMYHMVPV